MNAQKLLFSIGLLAASFTTLAQTTWNQIPVPTQERLNDIQFVNEQVGFIVGENGAFLKTYNGGADWDQPAIQGIPNQSTSNILDLDMLDAMNGFLTIENNFNIYRTTDGGFTWEAVLNNNTNQCFPTTVYVNTIDDVFVGGSDCFQGATINHYQSGIWTNQTVNYQTFDTQHNVVDMDFDGNLGLAAVNNEYFLRSVDGGTTWDSINSNIGNGNVLTSVMIASNDTCYAGYDQNGSGFGILYSTDDGATWQEDINSATFLYPAYYGATENSAGKIYMAAATGPVGVIFEKTGSSWQFNQVDQAVYAMDSYGSDVVFAVGDSGHVVVNQEISDLSVQELGTAVYSVNVYPNPTENQLQIETGEAQVQEIRLVGLNGEELRKVAVNSDTVDVSDLAPGCYFLILKTTEGIKRTSFVKK